MSYASIEDLETIGLPPDALEELTDPDKQAFLDADAGVMDVYLNSQYTLPIVAPYPQVLVRINVCLSVYSIMMRRGFNPEGPDKLYQENAMACKKMLEDISEGSLTIPDLEDGSGDDGPGGLPLINTQPLRGWGVAQTSVYESDEW